VVGKDPEPEAREAAKAEMRARHLASHPEDEGKEIECNVLWIVTGVERDGD
jgi:hypothetical protein